MGLFVSRTLICKNTTRRRTSLRCEMHSDFTHREHQVQMREYWTLRNTGGAILLTEMKFTRPLSEYAEGEYGVSTRSGGLGHSENISC